MGCVLFPNYLPAKQVLNRTFFSFFIMLTQKLKPITANRNKSAIAAVDCIHKAFIAGWRFMDIKRMDSDIGMMMEPSKKPLNVLIKQLHGNIEVVLKNGYEYKGKMIRCDGHMNLLLEGATECKEDQLMTNYGNVLLRGNNILYIVLNSNIH